MKVGNLVRNKSPFEPLTKLGIWHTCAVVASVEPFVLISEDGKARWDSKKQDDFSVECETVPDMTLGAVMERFIRGEKDQGFLRRLLEAVAG